MNWPEPAMNDKHTDNDSIPSAAEPTSSNTLFIGDTGELPLDTRRVLVQLLSGPALDGRRHPRLWPILLRDETVVRRQLAELFLDLIIDRDVQVAFTRQADTGDLEIPTLLRRAQLTFIDSVLLLYLRQRLTQSDIRGERAVISAEEIIEYLALYERVANTDHAGFQKRIHNSIEKTKKYNILQKIRASDNRFEISPTLKLLFSAEEIQSLTKLYQSKITEPSLPEDNTNGAPIEETTE